MIPSHSLWPRIFIFSIEERQTKYTATGSLASLIAAQFSVCEPHIFIEGSTMVQISRVAGSSRITESYFLAISGERESALSPSADQQANL
jgi:hypothetical protein